jgi:acyl carrier protein
MNSSNGSSQVTWAQFAAVTEVVVDDVLGRHQQRPVQPVSHLADDIGLDSFDIIVLLHEIEARFGVSLGSSVTQPTVGHLFDLVREAHGG